MDIERGDVYLARFPHAAGTRGKKRPVVVVQADPYNRKLRHAVVVQLTTNLADRDDAACLFIAADSNAGRSAVLSKDSVFSGYLISLMSEDRLKEQIGRLPDEMMQEIGECLRNALDLN